MSHLGKYNYGYSVSDILIKVGGLTVTSNDGVLADIILDNNYAVAQIVMPVLTYVTDTISLTDNPNLSNVDLSAMTSCNIVGISNNAVLTTIDFSGVVSLVGAFSIHNNAYLSTLDLSSAASMGQNTQIHDNANLTTLSFPAATGGGAYWYIHDNPALTTIDFPVLQAPGYWDSHINNNPALATLSFPAMTGGGAFYITDNASLTSIDFPVLTSGGGYFIINSNTSLTTINTPAMTDSAYWAFQILSNPALTSLDFSNLVTGNWFDVYGNASLTSVIVPDTFTGLSINLSNNALVQSGPGSVDQTLINLDTAGQSNGVIYINGGTNAAPSGAGITARNNLISKGWIVTTN